MSSDSASIDKNFNPSSLDLVLALLATFILPITAYFLFTIFGALIPLLLYYGVFCYAIVYWRRGTIEYNRTFSLMTKYFIGFFIFELILIIISTQTYKFTANFELLGFLLTLLIWAPINGFSEQLIWIYVYDVFDKLTSSRFGKNVGMIVGLFFYFSLIGLIHVLFWAQFLFEAETLKVIPWTYILLFSQFVVAIGYLVAYKKSKSMWPVFFLHVLTDLGAVILTGYSISPDLFHFL